MTREHWWNVDFDLALQPGWNPGLDPQLAKQVRQLENHSLLAAGPGDTVLVSEPPPEDFLSYLNERDIPLPGFSVMPEVRRAARFSPYGWSPQAIALRGRYDMPEPYPKLEAVRRVNDRRFGHDVETKLLGSETPLGSFASFEELDELMANEARHPHGWVVKTNHGNAALGNKRFPTWPPQETIRRWIGVRLERGPMVLERWLPRIADLSVVFDLSEDGVASPVRIHETIHTTDGGVIGAVFSREAPDLDRWRTSLEDAAARVSRALSEAGYFGPVCLDSLVWEENGSLRLRPLVEINARRHAGEGWSRVAEAWGGTVYGRFYTTRRLHLPEDYSGFEALLGADAFDRRSRIGALVTSPLWIESAAGRIRPQKIGVLFRGDSKESVLAMDARLRRTLEQ